MRASTTYDNVRRASWLGMLAGGDFIKTLDRKIAPRPPCRVTLVMLEAVRDFRATTGRQVGVRARGRHAAGGLHADLAAGGVRKSRTASSMASVAGRVAAGARVPGRS